MPDPLTLAAVAGGSSLASSLIGAYSANRAAKSQERNAGRAMDLQRWMYEQQRTDQAPWLSAGRQTLADLMQQMQAGAFDKQMDPSAIANDPGFQFRMSEGQKALERSAAARGGLNSGGTMKSLSRYSQGLASDEFQNAWSRNQSEMSNRFNRLASLAGIGQASAQNLGAMGGQYAGNMSNLYGALGNAQSAGAIGTGNAINSGIGQLGGLAGAAYLQGQQPQQQMVPPQYTAGYGMPPYR